MPFAEGTPTVKITLGGKVYEIGWTWGANRRVKERLKPEDKFEDNVAVVLWASMDKESREAITVEEIEDQIHPGNEAEVVGKFSELFKKSTPKEKPEKNGPPAPVKKPSAGNQTSKKSGQSESMISA